MQLHSYPKVYALGHAGVADLFLDPVILQEKIDGSQFSFGFFPEAQPSEIVCRSKGADLNIFAPDKMFAKGVENVKRIHAEKGLHPGWTYRGEYLAKPKHNALAYDRTPKDNIIVFDINTGLEAYMLPEDVATEAARIGLESVPLFGVREIKNPEDVRALLETVSCLGGQKIEGVVFKNYKRFGKDGKALMGKFFSEAYKEVHAHEWKDANPNAGDIIFRLVGKYKTATRWAKALQHLREAGKIEGAPKDIALLMPEAVRDIEDECKGTIQADLWAWAWPQLRRMLTSGLPEWYKDELLKAQFSGPEVRHD